jgi:hypothetical protein
VTPRRRVERLFARRPLSRRAFYALLACAAIYAVVRPVDTAPPPLVSQAFWGLIWSAISLVGGWLGAAGGAVSAALAATVSWLSATLSWLSLHVASLFRATGGMFSRVWDVSRRFWGEVIRPAFQHVYRWIEDARDWLKKKFGPVFRLISKVRERVRKIYDHWVRPILDGIETTRHVLQVLAALHIKWAAALDHKLGEVESVITENYLRILSAINRATDVLNSIVTGELLFQRLPFLRSLERDAPYWIRMWWTTQVVANAHPAPGLRTAEKLRYKDPSSYGRELGQFYRTGDGELASDAADLVLEWQRAAGLRPLDGG